MQGDQQDQMDSGGYLPDPYISSFFGENVDFQPSRDCPRNYIIFDRTDNRSQIMYNPGLNMGPSYFPLTDATLMRKDGNAPRVMEEDSADIDALMSFEDEDEEEEYEEEEVSTARTEGNDTNDTCSSGPMNSRLGVFSSFSSRESNVGERKCEKMRKMVRSIRGIVPGGNRQMNTADVLDEAVKYLKSLKVEAQKMGVGNLSG